MYEPSEAEIESIQRVIFKAALAEMPPISNAQQPVNMMAFLRAFKAASNTCDDEARKLFAGKSNAFFNPFVSDLHYIVCSAMYVRLSDSDGDGSDCHPLSQAGAYIALFTKALCALEAVSYARASLDDDEFYFGGNSTETAIHILEEKTKGWEAE